MKIAVFGPQRRVGALVGDQVIDLHAAAAALAAHRGAPRPYAAAAAVLPADLLGLIESGRRGLDAANDAVAHASAGNDGAAGEQLVVDVARTRLHAPLPALSSRIFNAGANFGDHLAGAMKNMGAGETTVEAAAAQARSGGAWHFVKHARNVVADGTPVAYPARTELLDYEGEVAVILAGGGKDFTPGDVSAQIWGYTLQNDLSIRETPNLMDLGYAKNFDGSAPLGPVIVVDEIEDPQNIEFATQVNGELRQQGNTADMVFSFGELLEYLSRDHTLFPGDLISAGTCAGTAMDASPRVDGVPEPGLFLKVGQRIEVSSPAIGTLTNQIVAAG